MTFTITLSEITCVPILNSYAFLLLCHRYKISKMGWTKNPPIAVTCTYILSAMSRPRATYARILMYIVATGMISHANVMHALNIHQSLLFLERGAPPYPSLP